MSDFDQNMAAARRYLQPFQDTVTGHYINGERVVPAGSKTYDNTTPTDNTSLGQVVEGSAADVDEACKAAEAAFPAWRDMPGAERKKLLNHFADKIVERAEEIALVESMDCGQPIRFMKQAAVRGAANFRFFADKAPEARNGLALHQDQHTNYTLRTPIGPVGVITPWNTPFMLSTWKIAPALAAGCTVVHKPAELSPLSAMLLADISHDAGIPAGVWNTVNGFGEVAGKTLSEHPAIKAVALVGETATGSHIMRQGADTLKRVHFELGGKNPVIVFDDANFDRALDAVVFMIYSLNGQRCTSSSRLLIQSGIRDRFIAALEDRVRALRVGHSLDPATEVGPLVHTGHFEKVMSYMDAAREDGATVAVGGERRTDLGPGNYVEPTLFTNADNTMRVAREEIFGPVLTAISFDTEEQAVALANDTPYGLTNYIQTEDTEKRRRVARRVRSGMVETNGSGFAQGSPFGGYKQSGNGREGGVYGLEEFLEVKAVSGWAAE